MGRSVSHRELKEREHRQGVTIFGVSAVVVALGGGLVVWNLPATRDPGTGCLKTPLGLHRTAAVDRTDPWTAPNQALLRAALGNLAETTPTEARLTLIPFDGGAEEVGVPLFDKCRPVEGKDVSGVLSTTAKIEHTYATTFASPVVGTIDELTRVGKGGAPHTYLVDFIAATGGGIGYRSQATRRVLRVYSDMAENTAEHSLIGKHPMDGKAFTAYVKERLGQHLQWVELELVATPSADTPAPVAQRLKTVWTAALTAAGVTFSYGRL